MTKTIPTDKRNNVYYGPASYVAAVEQIDAGRPVAEVIVIVRDAGYTGLARRLAKDYAGQLSVSK